MPKVYLAMCIAFILVGILKVTVCGMVVKNCYERGGLWPLMFRCVFVKELNGSVLYLT